MVSDPFHVPVRPRLPRSCGARRPAAHPPAARPPPFQPQARARRARGLRTSSSEAEAPKQPAPRSRSSAQPAQKLRQPARNLGGLKPREGAVPGGGATAHSSRAVRAPRRRPGGVPTTPCRTRQPGRRQPGGGADHTRRLARPGRLTRRAPRRDGATAGPRPRPLGTPPPSPPPSRWASAARAGRGGGAGPSMGRPRNARDPPVRVGNQIFRRPAPMRRNKPDRQ